VAWRHDPKNRWAYRKRTELAVALVPPIEAEGQVPNAPYGFDNGVLCRPLMEAMEPAGTPGVSE
jgi:hypothetical protein